ncbi:MAG: hypothetical protein ACRD47_09950, partial [Nitrososphaeraceae archaeon]
TRNSGGGLIDGPSQTNVYNIRQIGTNDVADLSITNPKLAPNSVGTTKYDEHSITTSKISPGAIQPQVIERVGSTVSVPGQQRVGGIAHCLAGEVPISGGPFVVEPAPVVVLYITNMGVSGDGWFTEMFNNGSPGGTEDFVPKVTCMPAMP